jgi:MFS family permease
VAAPADGHGIGVATSRGHPHVFAGAADDVRLPPWHWAYVLFRFGDGISHGLIPLVPLIVHDMPLWAVPATGAAMNLVSVPASYAWAQLMEHSHGVGRRRLAVAGFAVSGIAMAAMAFALPFWAFLVAAAVFTGFGVATAPAASVLVLESVPGRDWAKAAGHLSRRTSATYVVGGAIAALLGLAGVLRFWQIFLVAAFAAVGAACVAAITIRPHGEAGRLPTPRTATIQAMQRRIERPVWLPGRLRFAPTLRSVHLADGHPRRFLFAVFLLFVASTLFFAAYPGVLSQDIGLSLGWVLVAQMPSNVMTPLVYTYAGRWAGRHGDMRAAGVGVATRLLAVPALVLVILTWTTGSMVALLLAHAVVGFSFAFLQVSGSTIMAKTHRAGRGAGVGNYHAAVALGCMVGSTGSFLILLWSSFAWIAAAVLACLVLGSALFWSVARSPQFDVRNVADA